MGRSLLPEILVSLTHLGWMYVWWCFGHLIYIIAKKCPEAGFYGCSDGDPIGLMAAVAGSVLYMYIARFVLDFFYKGQLPGGNDINSGMLDSFMRKIMSGDGSNRKQRRAEEKKKR